MSNLGADSSDLTARLQATNADPPPDALLAAARAAYSWRSLDTDLCRPAYDSLLDESLTATRGRHDARMLRFTNDDLSIDLEITTDDDARSLVGQVTPPAVTELTIRHGGAHESVLTSDALGRFLLDGASAGPLSVRCRTSQETTLTTDWVLI